MSTQAFDPTKAMALTDVEPAVDELVRRLVRCLNGDGPDAGAPRVEGGSPEVEEVIVDQEVEGRRYLLIRMPKADRPQVQLSPRELEIVRMVAQGHPNKVIADVLSISSWTVCTYLRRIFAKLGVGSRAAMVARLMETKGGCAKSKAYAAAAAWESR
jgi:DNA-binding CsgD family transcriptional regulator